MISQLITEFLTKIDSIIEENPDVEHWCYSVSCGDTRSRRETVHKSTPYNPDDDGYTVDTLCEVLDGLVDEPVRWARLECRPAGRAPTTAQTRPRQRATVEPHAKQRQASKSASCAAH